MKPCDSTRRYRAHLPEHVVAHFHRLLMINVIQYYAGLSIASVDLILFHGSCELEDELRYQNQTITALCGT
jgi:hypothetical protein